MVQPTTFFQDDGALKVSCGEYVTSVLTRRGKLYTFGKGNAGRLGH